MLTRLAIKTGLEYCLKPTPKDIFGKAGVFHGKNYSCYLATRDDDVLLRKILRETPMQGRISIAFCREPDFFAPSAHTGHCYPFIVRTRKASRGRGAAPQDYPPGTPVMMCALSQVPVFWEGKVVYGSYLHLLRVLPEFRHRIGMIQETFAAMKACKDALELNGPCFTSIAADNAPARRLLEAGLPLLPVYKLAGEMETLAMSTHLGKSQGLLQQACANDIPELVEFYDVHHQKRSFAPALSEEWFRSLGGPQALDLHLGDFYIYRQQGRIVGSVALWNQQNSHQNIVTGYAPALFYTRPFYNLWAKVAGRPILPAVGSCINSVFLAFPAFDSAAKTMVWPCLCEALHLARQGKTDLGLLGVNAGGAFAEILRSVKAVRYLSRICSVHWAGESATPVIKLEACPEVALL